MKKLLLLLSALAVLLPVMAHAQEAAVAPNQAAIEYALEQQILWRRQNGNFLPSAPVTRVEFTLATVDLLFPAENFDHCYEYIAPSLPPRYTKLFSDVDTQTWFGKRLCAGIYVGIIQGQADGSFRPFDPITAAEASKILSRAYGLVYPSQDASKDPWFKAHMLALGMRGAIPSDMQPEQILSREKMATMFYALRNQHRPLLTQVAEAVNPVQKALAARSNTEVSSTSSASDQSSTDVPEGCYAYPIQSPGSALLFQGRSIAVHGVVRKSRRILRQEMVEAQTTLRGRTRVATPIANPCMGYPAQSPGAAQILRGGPAAVTPIVPFRSHRALRESTIHQETVYLNTVLQ